MSPATERAVLAAEVRESLLEADIVSAPSRSWHKDDSYKKVDDFLEKLARQGLEIRRIDR